MFESKCTTLFIYGGRKLKMNLKTSTSLMFSFIDLKQYKSIPGQRWKSWQSKKII